MRAHQTTLTLPVWNQTIGQTTEVVRALAFEHVAYHRTVGAWLDGTPFATWTVTHLASAMSIAADLPTQTAARDLALALEQHVTAWPHQDKRGRWVGVDRVRQPLRDWRATTVGGRSLRSRRVTGAA